MEVSSGTFSKDCENMEESPETPQNQKLELMENPMQEDKIMKEASVVEVSSESHEKESQMLHEVNFDINQSGKAQKRGELKVVDNEDISESSLNHSRQVETESHHSKGCFGNENLEKLENKDGSELVGKQENEKGNFLSEGTSINITGPSDSKNNAKDSVKFGNKIQEKQKQEQQPKKSKGGCVGENYERINYLVQTSRALVTMNKFDSDLGSMDFDQTLASQTGSLATAVGRRCLIRLTPSLKRMLCKGCGTALIYGVNARVRHRSNRRKHLVITCLTCNTIKRFVMDPNHKLWCDQEESLV